VFSTTPTIFLYAVFLIANYVFKQKNSGIFLLLLLLGVNQTFFGAVHSPLILAATIYLVFAGFRTIWKKCHNDFSPLVEMGIWAFLCLFLFVRVSPTTYVDVIDGAHHHSFIGYFSSVAISIFVISFGMAAYLALFWIYKKQFKHLILLGIWTVVMLTLIFIFGRNGLVDVLFELLFFPLIAGIVGFFVLFFRDEIQRPAIHFWILLALFVFAIFGQLRTFQEFKHRQNSVVKLLNHTPKTADKHALLEQTQQLKKYIDPTYLAFETPLIASLFRLPVQSVFFIPADTTRVIPNISEKALNPAYFHFRSSNYTVSDTPFIKRTLFKSIVYDTVVTIGGKNQFALNAILKLHRGDSVYLSVWRKGSDFGRLLITDDLRISTRLWMPEHDISEPNAAGWQRLSTRLIIDKTDLHKAYVWNENYKNERIYFKNFRIEIWRE